MLRNFFTTVAVGSLFVGGLAASHLAFAQPGPDGAQRGRGGMMAMADADKDGRISKAEMTAALDARFARMDVDKDGQITKTDHEQRRAQRQDARFAAMDGDKNGQVSKAEYDAAHAQKAERRADMGKARKHRGMGKAKMMHGRDGAMAQARKDGVLTKAEFLTGPMAMFDRADANKDGYVTADEMKAARQSMREQWKQRRAAQS